MDNRVIVDIERDGTPVTAIRLGLDEFGVPKHLLQGEKKEGIISDGSSIEPWYWDGFCTIDGWRYVYFGRCRIESIHSIATTHRHDALSIINKIAYALCHADSSFLDLSNGIFPLYRIYIYEGDKVLLLPPDLGDVVSIMIDEETKDRESTSLIQGKAEESFRLITEMAELMYYAAAGTLPFSRPEIKESGYKEIPLSLYATLPEKTDGFISFIFHARSREMRDITGNRNGAAALEWFLERSVGLEWTLGDISEEEREENVSKAEESKDAAAFLEQAGKTAKRNAFWRVKGTVITILAIAGVLLIAFLYSYISNLLKPPLTKDLDPVGIIYAVYDAQSNVDPQALDTAVKGDDLPQSMEVTNLFVTTRVRLAYESSDPAINVNDWIAQGKPAVPNNSYVYGVVVDSVEKTGENEYTAKGTWYVPFPYEETEEQEQPVAEAGSVVYRYSVTQTFSFTWNDRGWWNITDSEITEYTALEPEPIEVYVPEAPALSAPIGI